MDEQEISQFFTSYWKTQLDYSNKDKLFNLTWNDFVKIVSTMNIRTGGVNLEKRIIVKNNWKKITGHASHGDALTEEDKIVEIKGSIISPLPGSTISFKGIRPWHNIDFHYFIIIHISNYNIDPITTVFKLNSEQLNSEVKLGTIRPYSGKKADRNGQKNVQLGASFKKGDFERWKSHYEAKINL